MKLARNTLAFCLIPIGLGACALSGKSGQADTELPAAWKHAAGFPSASPAADLSRWWKRFDDPVLTRVISDALANNPDIATAAARVRQSRANRKAATAALFPALDGSAASNSNTVKTEERSRVSETSFSAGLDASWEADLFGKNRAAVRAAAADLNAAVENQRSAQAALASEIAIAYCNLRADETRLSVLRRIVKSREETSQLAAWRQQAGEADSLESSQALASLEQARSGIPALQQRISQNRNLLALLVGLSPGSLDGLLSSGNRGIPEPARSLAIGIPADTIRQRPDVRSAGYQLAAAAARTSAAHAERFPSLRLTGSLGMNTLSAGKLFNPQTTSADLIAGLTGPIFDAGRIRANIEAQGAVEEQALQAYRSAVLTALSEVEDALIASRRSAERLTTLEHAAAAAREAAGLAQQRYEAGVIDLLTVLDSQRTLLGLEDNLLTVRADVTTAYIQLYKALGGGWS